MQIWLHPSIARILTMQRNPRVVNVKEINGSVRTRIGTDGSIKGPCGTSKDKKNPDRCLPKRKALSLTKSERASTARKKKAAGAKGKTVVANTPRAKVRTK
jgi:hypothetical protein